MWNERTNLDVEKGIHRNFANECTVHCYATIHDTDDTVWVCLLCMFFRDIRVLCRLEPGLTIWVCQEKCTPKFDG